MSKTLNIFFTCAGRRVALLNAFRRALAALKVRGRLIAADVAPHASAACAVADEAVSVPPVSDPDYSPTLRAAVRRYEAGLLVPLTDLDLLGLAEQRDAFVADGCTVMIGSPQAIRTCRDKAAFSRALAAAGIPVVRSCTLEAFRAEPFYPCFIKPVSGSSGIGTAILRDATALEAHVRDSDASAWVVQEYATGREYTIDVYRSRDGQVRCVVPRQRLDVRSGEVQRGVTVADDELISAARRVAEAVEGLWGVFCCQCRRRDRQPPRFFELNPRFGGGAPLAIAAGADLPLYLLQEVLGRPITADGTFTDRLLMLRYDEAVFLPVDDPRTLPGYDTPSFR